MRIVQIDEDTGFFPTGGLKNRLHKADEIEGGERLWNPQIGWNHLEGIACFSVCANVGLEVSSGAGAVMWFLAEWVDVINPESEKRLFRFLTISHRIRRPFEGAGYA